MTTVPVNKRQNVDAEVREHCREDQVELNRLQGRRDRTDGVAVDDGRAVDLDRELVHVEVVRGCEEEARAPPPVFANSNNDQLN